MPEHRQTEGDLKCIYHVEVTTKSHCSAVNSVRASVLTIDGFKDITRHHGSRRRYEQCT